MQSSPVRAVTGSPVGHLESRERLNDCFRVDARITPTTLALP